MYLVVHLQARFPCGYNGVSGFRQGAAFAFGRDGGRGIGWPSLAWLSPGWAWPGWAGPGWARLGWARLGLAGSAGLGRPRAPVPAGWVWTGHI